MLKKNIMFGLMILIFASFVIAPGGGPIGCSRIISECWAMNSCQDAGWTTYTLYDAGSSSCYCGVDAVYNFTLYSDFLSYYGYESAIVNISGIAINGSSATPVCGFYKSYELNKCRTGNTDNFIYHPTQYTIIEFDYCGGVPLDEGSCSCKYISSEGVYTPTYVSSWIRWLTPSDIYLTTKKTASYGSPAPIGTKAQEWINRTIPGIGTIKYVAVEAIAN